MKKILKKILNIITSRALIYILMLLAQLGLFYILFAVLREYNVWVYLGYGIVTLIFAFSILNRPMIPEYKTTWMMVIMLMPLFGTLLYFFFGENHVSKFIRKKIERLSTENKLSEDNAKTDEISDELTCNLSNYIFNTTGYPMQYAEEVQYYDMGEKYFEAIKEELKKAEKFIFIEFFIIDTGKMWDGIYEILLDKIKEGVEVKLLYDDFGTLFTLPNGYDWKLKRRGIDLVIFNRMRPFLDVQMNNRTHRKIIVIDGRTAFSGGVNIADEYINEIEKYGHWKDTGFMIRGEAVNNFTNAFLELFYTERRRKAVDDEGFAKYHTQTTGAGIPVQPFYDSPLDGKHIFQEVYTKIILSARKYVYINSPYLIIDNQMKAALAAAAASGVDVRITIPGKPDKAYAYSMTLSNAEELAKKGVKIYKYTSGFIHAKSFVCDDKYVVIGTANLDYRSLFLHFECGALVYDEEFAGKLKQDFLATEELCSQIDPKKRTSLFRRFWRGILKLLAPLM